MIEQKSSVVNLNSVEERLEEIFQMNPIFKPERLKEENTFEYNVESFILKITTGRYAEIFKENKDLLDNLYVRLETFKLENLSRYSNEGFVSYDSVNNVGKINTYALASDDSQSLNVNNIFSQLLLMVATSKENYYGIGNVEELKSLNDACSYMLATSVSSASETTLFEEEYNCLQKLDLTLKANGSEVDFAKSYITNSGEKLKEELLKTGIDNNILGQLNYINQAKKSNISIIGMYPKIDNEINKNFARIVSSKAVDKDIVSSYEANMLKDGILDSSTVGMTEISDNMIKALDYLKTQKLDGNVKNQVMQRVV